MSIRVFLTDDHRMVGEALRSCRAAKGQPGDKNRGTLRACRQALRARDAQRRRRGLRDQDAAGTELLRPIREGLTSS
jgi:hypothetical protein